MAKEFKPKVSKREKEMPQAPVQYMASGGLFGDIANQFTTTNDYQGQLAPVTNTNYQSPINSSALYQQQGYQNFLGNQNQQQNLANSLQLNAQGQGPNPAQAMLSQATGQNVANQAALAAGQRGANANVGMIARQAAQAGMGAQQQAAGQAATMQAKQQLAAQQQQAQVLGQMGQQNIGEQNANTGMFGTAAGAQNAQNNSNISNYGMMQGINSGVSQNNTNAINKTEGGFLNGFGGGLSALVGLAHGGMVENPKLAKVPMEDRFPAHLRGIHDIYHSEGGVIQPANSPDLFSRNTNAIYKTRAKNMGASEDMNVARPDYHPREMMSSSGDNYASGGQIGGPDVDMFQAANEINGQWAEGDMSPAQLGAARDMDKAPARENLTQEEEAKYREQDRAMKGPVKSAGETKDFRSGGRVPGEGKVPGDSLKNDIQPAMLSPKEIVLPRSVTMAPDAPEQAKAFVEALLRKQGHGNSKHHQEFHKALKKAILSRKGK